MILALIGERLLSLFSLAGLDKPCDRFTAAVDRIRAGVSCVIFRDFRAALAFFSNGAGNARAQQVTAKALLLSYFVCNLVCPVRHGHAPFSEIAACLKGRR
jgi:hypothetical protein